MRPAMSTPHQPMGGRHRDDSPSTAHQQTTTGDVDTVPTNIGTGSGRFAIDRPPTDTTGDVDTISTDIGTGSRPWTLISPTGDPRGGLPDATTTDGDSPRLPAGGAHTTVQQQVLKLAGVV